MPIFFQQDIDADTRMAIWKIEEDEDFFLQHVPLQRAITHPHKRLQHLAGRYLLQYLFADFPINLIKIADTRKPFLEDEAYHFSISHCGDYAAAIVSKTKRVGVDIEVPTPRVDKIKHKFLDEEELAFVMRQRELPNGRFNEAKAAYKNVAVSNFVEEKITAQIHFLTLFWCCKEAMFKWWGLGDVEFKSALKIKTADPPSSLALTGRFKKDTVAVDFPITWKAFAGLLLAWVVTEPI